MNAVCGLAGRLTYRTASLLSVVRNGSFRVWARESGVFPKRPAALAPWCVGTLASIFDAEAFPFWDSTKLSLCKDVEVWEFRHPPFQQNFALFLNIHVAQQERSR